MGPFLLALGVIPEVSSASSAFMSFYTTSANLLTYGLKGQVPAKMGVIIFLIGLIGGLIGRLLALQVVAKLGKTSFIAFMLSATIFISMSLAAAHLVGIKVDFTVDSFC